MFERIVNEANDAIIVAECNPAVGPGFRIVYSNQAFTRIFGYAHDEVVGRSPRLLQGTETSADTIEEISRTVHRGGSIHRRILNYARDGQRVWVDVNIVSLPSPDGKIRRFAAIERDVTAEVRHEQYLEELAFADPLTKLANRRYFEQMLGREIARAQRTGQPLSLAVLDIDHFKVVNDTWGHPIGDRVLVVVARTILQSVRPYDHVARVGGEEFTLLLPGADYADAMRIVERVCGTMRSRAHVVVGKQTIAVTCSSGVTLLDVASDTAADMIGRADRALYLAKQGGRNRVIGLRCEPERQPAVPADGDTSHCGAAA